jgi:mRNA-degrading endonuclease RelE of RelBE toxin-antitoxin system
MKGKKGELRLRVRIYRILFHVEDDVVVIDDVDTRGQIYK